MLSNQTLLEYLRHYFGEGPAPDPIQDEVHLALHVSGTPPDIDAGTGFVEPSASEYNRIQISNASFWSPAEIETLGIYEGFAIKQNVQAVTWPEAETTWGTPTHVGMFGAPAGGAPLAVAKVSEGQVHIVSGVQVRFSPGRLTLIARRF